jgi:hypothetical protein
MVQAWAAGLPTKTGKSLDEWIALVREEGPSTERERRIWLKEERGLGANAAWWIAERSLKKGWMDGGPEAYLRSAEGYVAMMFSEGKGGLRPIFDELIRLGMELGADVKVCPCQTVVPLYRQHVFAQIKPAGGSRIELGLALKDAPPSLPPRLVETGGLEMKERITHRFSLAKLGDIDAEVRRWFKIAYDLDA